MCRLDVIHTKEKHKARRESETEICSFVWNVEGRQAGSEAISENSSKYTAAEVGTCQVCLRNGK